MAKAALDDKDLRSDAFRDLAFQAIDYVYRRRWRFVAGAVALLIVAGTGVGLFAYSRVQRQRMAAEFNAAERLYLDPATPQEERITKSKEAFRAFLAAHGDSSLAPFAGLYLAALALQGNAPEQAEQAYRQVAEHPEASESLRVIAQTGLAKIAENRAQYDQSAALYRSLPEERYGDLMAYSLGRIAAVQEQPAEARKQLESLEQKYPDSPLAPLAREALSYYP